MDGKPSRTTRVVRVDPDNISRHAIAEAAAVLRGGGLVAFPTETVYGLGANALSEEAVAGIFWAKGRPADNPLIVHVPDAEKARELAATWTDAAERAAKTLWPGPLTLVLPAAPHIPSVVTAGLPTVALRVPAHPVAHALLVEARVPVAAPSANRSGRPSPTRAEHVWEDLHGRIDLIIDGGTVGIGLESTVLDISVDPPVVLRPGGLDLETLRGVLGRVEVDPGLDSVSDDLETPRSPGMKYRHYAPRCPAVVVEGKAGPRSREVARLAEAYRRDGLQVGVIATAETVRDMGAAEAHSDTDVGTGSAGHRGTVVVRVTGPRNRADLYARHLFEYLRELDRLGCDLIIMEGIEAVGIGFAVMNRLRKAAGFRIVRAGERGDGPSL